jgi:hypothetical protein
MVIELEPVDVTKVARFRNAQDHRFQEPIKVSQQVQRRYLGETSRQTIGAQT